LPDRATGSALFADISGFTALTESLRESLGPRRGAEELSEQLESVYSALIAEVERYGGSVIGFAGDAMLCWFDQQNMVDGRTPATSAVASALAMQTAIRSFPALALKVAIATGPVRRFVVGDEAIQRLDVLAGTTVARTAIGEHLASKREVLVDEASAKALGDALSISAWRGEGERFAVVERSFVGSAHSSAHSLLAATPVPDHAALRPFIHRDVYDRVLSQEGAFLTESRPCAALFIRFTGIDYDSDSAAEELDDFIRQVQRIASRHEGALINVTVGDKGSYGFVSFGALSAHEDDSRRAVKTALELRNKTELKLQMGIAQGLMRVGAHGGETRKVFGALGDAVNLAARLMTTANEDEILLSGQAHKAVGDAFTFEPRPPLRMKGKAEPLPVFAVTGESRQRAVRLQEPNYSLPMVGRVRELQVINARLDLAAQRRAQVIGIVAEAGLGKSRLVAEVIRSARRKGFVGFGGSCQSDGVHTPYLAWKSIWQAFFDIDHEMALKRQMRLLESHIGDKAPSRVDALPLLNVVLDLNIPENEFTASLEPKTRQSALHALLEDCLKAQAVEEPTLIVLEDLHWIDALSHDLLEQLAKALARHAVCFVLAYRPRQAERGQPPRIEALERFTRVELHELTKAEATLAIRAKLAQLYPARGGALPEGLVDALMARAQGNPFYLEELLNYLHDRGLDPADIENIELPDSLHTLILSRIDQLSEQEKTILRLASIVGRLFRAKWLAGYYPELGSFPQVKATLDELDRLEITPLESEAELIYLFKHIVTHEVTYESLPFATRARLHERLARFLESAEASVDTIAHHYARSENQGKKKEFLWKAGEAAQQNFANAAALEYYGQLLRLPADATEQAELHLRRGAVLELIGQWPEAESDYCSALTLAGAGTAAQASAQLALGKLCEQRGDYPPALDWVERARATWAKLGDQGGVSRSLIETGIVFYLKGDYPAARRHLDEGLALARSLRDQPGVALALNRLGHVAWNQGDYPAARALFEESMALWRELGDRRSTSVSLNNLGVVTASQGDFATAWALHEENLTLRRKLGDKWGVAASLNNLGVVAFSQGAYPAARALHEESLALLREMGNKRGVAMALNNLGGLALAQHDYATARRDYAESLTLDREIGDKEGLVCDFGGLAAVRLGIGHAPDAARLAAASETLRLAIRLTREPTERAIYEGTVAAARAQLGEHAFDTAWVEGSRMTLEEAINLALDDAQQSRSR
jgi:class 3 adenylate cyclase/tetratricopeptide (TPR) repeat protein